MSRPSFFVSKGAVVSAISLLVTVGFTSFAAAQAPSRIVMSLSGPGTLSGQTIDDEELFLKEIGQISRPFLLDQARFDGLRTVEGGSDPPPEMH